MDTVHVVTKRIEQALTQLQRELRREGLNLPTETFTVTTGDGITVEAASRPAPVQDVGHINPMDEIKEAIEQRMTPAELRRSKKNESAESVSEPSDDVPTA